MTILLHTSKTMRSVSCAESLTDPKFLSEAKKLNDILKTYDIKQLMAVMKISEKLAVKVKDIVNDWSHKPREQNAAIDSFVGDIYSGLRSQQLSKEERLYTQEHMRIISGLYGLLRPLDKVMPYRLEMGYKLEGSGYKNMYEFWGAKLAQPLKESDLLLNLTAEEYFKTIRKYIEPSKVITPKFLTYSKKHKEPRFVVVHAKIARGAFARWCIKNKVNKHKQLLEFNDLGYSYSSTLSEDGQPAFVCKDFKGIGLSQRLVK